MTFSLQLTIQHSPYICVTQQKYSPRSKIVDIVLHSYCNNQTTYGYKGLQVYARHGVNNAGELNIMKYDVSLHIYRLDYHLRDFDFF